jgi:hypothetical protein
METEEITSMRAVVLIVLLSLASPTLARAEQYASGGHVVHTRRAPVVAHKVVPPYRGVHVYQGRTARR